MGVGTVRLLQMSHGHATTDGDCLMETSRSNCNVRYSRRWIFRLSTRGWNEQKLHGLGFTHVLVTERDIVFIRPDRYQLGEYDLIELQP